MFKENLKTVAIFGGSFDPPHFGHKMVVKEALSILEIDKLLVVPAFLNPFKEHSYFEAKERLELTMKLLEGFEIVEVNDYEIEEGRATPTAQTLRHFKQLYDVQYLIIGADNLENIEKWHEFEWLNSEVTWVIATRAGYALKSNKLRAFKLLEVEADISSTKIRETIKESSYMSINEMTVEQRAERIVTFLDEKKADELEVFNFDEVDYIAKRVVIANAISSKHAAALADMLKKELKPLGEEFLHMDESDEWVVVDLGDILIHLMTTEARQTYNMEEFLTELSEGKFKSSHTI